MKVTVGDHVMSRHLAPDAKPWKCDGRIMRLAQRGEEMMAGTRQFAFAFFPGWAAGSVTGPAAGQVCLGYRAPRVYAAGRVLQLCRAAVVDTAGFHRAAGRPLVVVGQRPRTGLFP